MIDFNGLLPVGPSILFLPVWRVNYYSCHLWGIHLIYAVVFRHMNDTGLMDEAGFLFSCTRVIFLLINNNCGIQKFNKVIMSRVISNAKKANTVPRSPYTRTIRLKRRAMATLMAHYQRGLHCRGRTSERGLALM